MDELIQQAEFRYQLDPSQENQQHLLNLIQRFGITPVEYFVQRRSGTIPIEYFVPLLNYLEIESKDAVYQQLRQWPSYQTWSHRDQWDIYSDDIYSESVEVFARGEWVPSEPTWQRVSFPFKGESSFHLQPCFRCELPGWQQPCPFCGFYPSHPSDYVKRPLGRDYFLRTLSTYPSFYHFYARKLAANRVPLWQPIANLIRDEMVIRGNLYHWPSYEEIWDYFT